MQNLFHEFLLLFNDLQKPRLKRTTMTETEIRPENTRLTFGWYLTFEFGRRSGIYDHINDIRHKSTCFNFTFEEPSLCPSLCTVYVITL